MNRADLIRILRDIKGLRIAVAGDYFLDKYLLIDGSLTEISLETGLDAYQVTGKKLSPGAAGTVAKDIRALGAGHVYAVGYTGDDGEGLELRTALGAIGVDTTHLMKSRDRMTPTYTKPLVQEKDGPRELNRLDIKNRTATPPALEEQIMAAVEELLPTLDALVLLDQVTEEGCGVLTGRVRSYLSDLAAKHQVPVLADSRLDPSLFVNIIVKCNHHELVRSVAPHHQGAVSEADVEQYARLLAAKTNRPVFVTMGEWGQMALDGDRIYRAPGLRVPGPVDICGAGDAAMAGIACALAAGSSFADAALLGNIVASITVQQLGDTGTASPEQVMERFGDLPHYKRVCAS